MKRTKRIEIEIFAPEAQYAQCASLWKRTYVDEKSHGFFSPHSLDC